MGKECGKTDGGERERSFPPLDVFHFVFFPVPPPPSLLLSFSCSSKKKGARRRRRP